MAEQLRVFVSHSHHDNAFCHAIVAALRDAGADVWYDEHNLGWGELHEVIQREMGQRPIFVLILSKAVFASTWVKRETKWAYKLYDRDPTRAIVPVTAGQIEATDFDPEAGWLFLDDFKRIEAPGYKPYPVAEATRRLLRALGLTPPGEVPDPVAPQLNEDVDDLLTRAKALIAQEKYVEALPLFERATQLAPNSFDAWANIGSSLGNLGRNQEALVACNRALALDGKQAWVWYNKGTALGHLGRYEEALAACNRALEIDPNLALAWYNQGVALGNLGRYQEELVAQDRALAFEPSLAQAWNNKGVALNSLGRYEEALAACNRALEIDPSDAFAWGNCGSALFGLGREQEALEAFDRAIALDPDSALAWDNKGIALRGLGRTAEARAAEKRARELGWRG